MKNIYSSILIVVLVFFATFNCKSQWVVVYHDNNTQFYDAAFPTNYTGFVAAADTGGAVVLRTHNAGASWNKRYIAGWGFINKIVMLDSLNGYLIKGGVPVKIARTSDGFATYTVHNLDSSFAVQAISLVDDSTGFYLNNGSKLRKFTHSGAAYTHVLDTLTDGQNLQFINSQTGYFDNGNGLLMTNDGGTNWSFANINLGFYCTGFRFADSTQGYFSDLDALYKTNDGGSTFPLQFHFPNVYSFAVNGDFSIAANDTGTVAYTTDGGVAWQTEATGIQVLAPEPYKVFCSPDKHCYLFSEFCGEIRKRLAVATEVLDLAPDGVFSLYPNPSNSETNLVFPTEQKNTHIKIVDLLGKEVETICMNGKQVTIEKNQLLPGIYFVKTCDAQNHCFCRKLIIN